MYDHCLSEKEVEEIAKGLVLHYKLNEGNPNLLLASDYIHTLASNDSTLLYYYFDFSGTLPTGTYTFSFDAKTHTTQPG